MDNLSPQIRHLTPIEYQTKPWKNGKGQTQDILLLPQGADHSNFDIRFALSPIVEEAKFSSFPGADRVITLIEGSGLDLLFDTSTKRLKKLDSCRFDTSLTPIGKPVGDSVRVINVMARRGAWNIITCEIASQLNILCALSDILFVFALQSGCSVSTKETSVKLKQYDSLLVNDCTDLKIGNLSGGQVLFAHLKPTSL